MRAQKSHRRRRGTTLLEGMIASLVFLAGASSILAGSIAVSRQNFVASKINRASSIAEQVRAGLYAQGLNRLRTAGTGVFDSSRCNPALSTYASSTSGVTPSPCLVDLDAFDTSPPSPNLIVMPGYPAADSQVFRRVLAIDKSDPRVYVVGIYISYRDGIGVRTYEQYVSLYDPALCGVGTDNNIL